MCWVGDRALNPTHQKTVPLFLERKKRGWDIPQSENEEKSYDKKNWVRVNVERVLVYM